MAADPRTTAGGLARSHSFLTNDSSGSTVGGAASETSPLLRSGATSPTLRDLSPRGLDRQRVDDHHPYHHHDDDDDDDDDDAVPHRVTPIRAACIALSMWMLMFMQACNLSGMAMVQGHIAEDLKAYDSAMWFTSAYLIATASASPLAGRLVTIFSLGSMVLTSALLFAAGAIITSRASSFAVFILGRTLTGMGGGCIMTLSLILVLQLTTRRRRGLLVGMVNAGFTVGVSAGAVVFAALLPVLGWRELFLAQVPVALLAGLGVYLSIPTFAAAGPTKDRSTLQKLRSIDYAGALSLVVAIVLFLYGLSGTIQPLPMLLSVPVLAFFLFNECRLASDPLIPMSILRSRGVLLSCLAQLGLMAARWSVLFYAPVFALAIRGLPPAVAGAALLPTNLAFALGGVLVGGLHVRRAGSFWLPCVASMTLFGLALLALSRVSTAAAPVWLWVAVVVGNGLATGAAMNYTLAHVLHVSAPGAHYVATGLLATFRGFAGSFGTSIGGGIFARTLRARLAAGFAELDGAPPSLSPERASLVSRLVAGPNLVFGGSLSEVERAVAVRGYEGALRVLYTSAVALTVVVVLIQAGTGWAAPANQESEDEIRAEIAEADGTMEA